MAYDLNAQSDKTVIAIGEKKITNLNGEKNILEFDVSSDKIILLSGTKGGNYLLGEHNIEIILDGEKSIEELQSSKGLDGFLLGTRGINVYLEGDEPDGFWHILISATFITVDTTLISSDRN